MMSEPLQNHQLAERLAAQADLLPLGEESLRADLFSQAADLEAKALETVAPEAHPRTYSIVATSSASLYFKASRLREAERIATSALQQDALTGYAREQLEELLNEIWNARRLERISGADSVSATIQIALRGEAIGYGIAPVGVVMDKISGVEKVVYRLVEFLGNRRFRTRGPVPREVRAAVQALISQPQPGSYRFDVRLQAPAKLALPGIGYPSPNEVADKFMALVTSISEGTEPSRLRNEISSDQYRGVLVRLVRNIVPDGTDVEEIEFRHARAGERKYGVLRGASREGISTYITQELLSVSAASGGSSGSLEGVLRALDLDGKWIELSVGSRHVRCDVSGLLLDDVVGPMVNRKVIAHGHWRDSIRRNLVVV